MSSVRKVEVPGCRRHADREAVTLAVSALSLGCSRSAIVSDLSVGGAQLDAGGLPETGADLLLVAGSQEAFGKVVWRTDRKCGVRFDDNFAEANIALMKQEASWASVACFSN